MSNSAVEQKKGYAGWVSTLIMLVLLVASYLLSPYVFMFLMIASMIAVGLIIYLKQKHLMVRVLGLFMFVLGLLLLLTAGSWLTRFIS